MQLLLCGHAHRPESPEVYWLIGGDSAPWSPAGGAKRAETEMRGCPKPHSGPHLVKIHHPLYLHLIRGQTRGWRDECAKKSLHHSSTADRNTSFHGSVPVLRVVGDWCGVSRGLVANHKVDCSLKESNSLLHRLIFKWKTDSLRFDKLTPIFCPFSFSKGMFLDGSDLSWPEESSRNGIFVDPRNLWYKKMLLWIYSHLLSEHPKCHSWLL